MTTMSALEARCCLAMAKVLKPLDAGRAMDLEFEAWHAARELGYNAPELEQAPIMLNHESFLLLAWREGQADRHGRDAIEANAASDIPDVHILYCPRGCNQVWTTRGSDECGGCGQVMRPGCEDAYYESLVQAGQCL